MELVIIIAVVIIALLFYFGGKFANFKSQLMNELGKRGMDFQSADVLYTVMADQINKMHHDGVPVETIAERLCVSTDDNVQHRTLEKQYSSFEVWFETFKIECDATKPGVTPFLEFMDISGLQMAYEQGEDPTVVANQFANNFDPSKML